MHHTIIKIKASITTAIRVNAKSNRAIGLLARALRKGKGKLYEDVLTNLTAAATDENPFRDIEIDLTTNSEEE